MRYSDLVQEISVAGGDRVGGTLIRSPQSDSVVIFIHGILSDGEAAWTHANGTFWPTLVARENDVQHVGIYSFVYRSDVFARTYSVGDVVDYMRECFDVEHLWRMRRLAFVCHSLGGIVARRFVVAHSARLIDAGAQVGLFLVASPSLGSADATRLAPLIRMLRSTQGEALRFSQSNVWLNDLDKDFIRLKDSREKRRLEIRGKELVEDEPIVVKKRLGLSKQLVEPFSAARYFADSLKVPYSDHNTIAKPEGSHAIQHRALVLFLQRFTSTDPERHLDPVTPDETQKAINVVRTLDDRLTKGAIRSDDALMAVSDAIFTTSGYLRHRGLGGARDADVEAQLSELWRVAAEKILPYDTELANLSWVKGRGWADETVWDDPRYTDLPTKLDDILERLTQATRRIPTQTDSPDAIDVVEGRFTIDTLTWRTTVLLPPFRNPPEITVASPDGRADQEPSIESITPDKFTARISSNRQSGEWVWRARGVLLKRQQ